MKRLIILVHRYLGIPMSVVFVVWFVSGIVMIYTNDMPSLGSDDRLRGLGPIALESVSLSAADAAAGAGLDGPVMLARLDNLLGRPAWHFRRVFGPETVVFADNGARFDGAEIEAARAEVARFTGRPVAAVTHLGTVSQIDQWTIQLARSLPLERFAVDDGRATEAYFSLASGEVVLVTDRGRRLLAWLGAIPHWFYFTPLRENQPAWYWTVVWVSAAGVLLATLGLVLAFTQFRRSKPFRLSVSVRYRGWMRWHYYTGAVFGLLALTWVFSGMLSMEPFDWTNAEGMDLPPNDLGGGPLELDAYSAEALGEVPGLAGEAPLEIELIRIRSEPYFLIRTLASDDTIRRRLVDARQMRLRNEPFTPDAILTELRATVTEASVARSAVLDRYDAYYYVQGNAAPLPVLRVEFDDPAATWYYFDLMTLAPVAANHRLSRLERWLFNGLHSLDFPFWYNRRPLWDIAMIALSLGALATSGIGFYLGFRRLFGRPLRQTANRGPVAGRSDSSTK